MIYSFRANLLMRIWTGLLWRAVVDFQWHPEMTMSTPDSQINPAGMQVLSYKAEQDD